MISLQNFTLSFIRQTIFLKTGQIVAHSSHLESTISISTINSLITFPYHMDLQIAKTQRIPTVKHSSTMTLNTTSLLAYRSVELTGRRTNVAVSYVTYLVHFLSAMNQFSANAYSMQMNNPIVTIVFTHVIWITSV